MSLIKTELHRRMTNPDSVFPFAVSDKEFVDSLFDKLLSSTDTDMIDLQDDDSCCDHIEFQQLEIDV